MKIIYDLKNDILNSELERIDALIKMEKYEDAKALLDYLEKNYGPSGKLYLKKAKFHTCLFEFNEALEEYKKANESYILCIGNGEDPICTFNIPKIKKLINIKMTKKQFMDYIIELTGNENYTIPSEVKYTFKPSVKEKITLKTVWGTFIALVLIVLLVLIFLHHPLLFI